MSRIDELSIIGPQDGRTRTVEYGTEQLICGPPVCGSEQLRIYRCILQLGESWTLPGSTSLYQLLYTVRAGAPGTLQFKNDSQALETGAGVLLTPNESARVAAGSEAVELLHMQVPKPPATVENDLPGGPGYLFTHRTLRALGDSSGGRVRRFCAESSVRLRDGRRLTPTNAIQAGEMHYKAGGASPYHVHNGTDANPNGAEHCYITFRGSGSIEVDNQFRDIAPGTLVYIPPGVPHRLRAVGGSLDYFEVQAWRSFKTTILSEEPLGLKWFYERENSAEALTEWNQS